MGKRIEELDWRSTPMGDLCLRRRRDPATGRDVHEVKLGDEFLMSSLFTRARSPSPGSAWSTCKATNSTSP
ncbi:hypothetical protein [Streptomyces mesophilus]|uniref:hypothetical protein n=1 Tax=Streptomyces mesophilus TaxID=1775132 RepID=UPI0038B66C7D